jgi:uncharacterized protein
MNVVIDTNVLASGIFWGGTPLKIIRFWTNNHIKVVVSEEILNEYLRVVEKIATSTGRYDLYEYWSLIIPKMAKLVKVKKLFQLCRDPADNKFLDCAISGKAKYLISGDQDLLVLGNVMRVQIITPRKFLDVLKSN